MNGVLRPVLERMKPLLGELNACPLETWNPPCYDHSKTEPEYYRDKPTGYIVCAICGETASNPVASTT